MLVQSATRDGRRAGVRRRRSRTSCRRSRSSRTSTNIVSPIEQPNAGLVSRDRHSALVQFDVKGKAEDAKDKIAPILAAIDDVQAGNPSLIIEEFGQASADHQVDQRFERDMGRAEFTSLPLTIAILVVAFGALVAAGLPVLLAFSAVLAATGLNQLVSHVVPTDEQTLGAIILMIGMAVGIDYSLFYLRREREERHARPTRRTRRCSHAARTSGQAVLDLRRDRADRDGRHVRLRQLALHHDRRSGR